MSRKNYLLSNTEIAFLCEQLHLIVTAELPIYYGISLIRDETADANIKELLTKISEPMEKGVTLYEALSDTGVFPNYMLQMIQIGEQTGRLDDVLNSLEIYYEREADIRTGIRHAITYPLIMSAMMFIVIIVLITKVVPIFSQVYAELGSTLTGSAKLLMDISRLLNQYLVPVMIGFLLFVVLLIIFFQSPFGKKFYENRGYVRSLCASRVANCMYLALASGLNMDEGLALAETLVENVSMEKRIQHCRSCIKNGDSFAKSLIESQIFSRSYASIITIGYTTSAMDDVMLRISQAYEQETEDRIQHFISILEPALIMILSFFIGLILVAFLLPLLGIMSGIG